MWRVIIARSEENSTLLSSELPVSSPTCADTSTSMTTPKSAVHHSYSLPAFSSTGSSYDFATVSGSDNCSTSNTTVTHYERHHQSRHHSIGTSLLPPSSSNNSLYPHQQQFRNSCSPVVYSERQPHPLKQHSNISSQNSSQYNFNQLQYNHCQQPCNIQKSNSAIKKSISDSDCDDAFSEESGKEPSNSPGIDSCHPSLRKRRRGMIEKKRRDRINASLAELRRLVPSAAHDPHSGKLEKAEILQLTVEHLRTLKNKDGSGYNSPKLVMDYYAVAWNECITEVGRYLVTIEGMDDHDPLRLRLLSHLQNFQREQQGVISSDLVSVIPCTGTTGGSNASAASVVNFELPAEQTTSEILSGSPSFPYSSSSGQSSHLNSSHQHQHLPITSTLPYSSSFRSSLYPQQNYQQQSQHHYSYGKPYRPWGTELAY